MIKIDLIFDEHARELLGWISRYSQR